LVAELCFAAQWAAILNKLGAILRDVFTLDRDA
jgi:hypothetical protein